MMPQDFIIAITNILLSYALFPQILHNFKEKKNEITFQTSIISTFALYIPAFTVYSLDLIISSITTFAAATLWLIILIQKFIYK